MSYTTPELIKSLSRKDQSHQSEKEKRKKEKKTASLTLLLLLLRHPSYELEVTVGTAHTLAN